MTEFRSNIFTMSDNWFFDQNFNLIEENFFDDVNLDQSLNDMTLEGDNVNGQKWDDEFQSLQPPPPMFYGDSCCAGLDESQIDSVSSPFILLTRWCIFGGLEVVWNMCQWHDLIQQTINGALLFVFTCNKSI